MVFPLTLSDISLWLAVVTIVLLITSEMLYYSPSFSARLLLDRKVLRFLAVGCGVAFGVTVLMRVSGAL